MDKRLVIGLATEMAEKYGLITSGWEIEVRSRMQRTLGRCFHTDKVIALSENAISCNPWKIVEDIILHEIAHARLGPGFGHGLLWKAMAIRVGANPERLCTEATMPKCNWVGVCPRCGNTFRRYRKSEGNWCKRCGPAVGRLVWHKPTINIDIDDLQ